MNKDWNLNPAISLGEALRKLRDAAAENNLEDIMSRETAQALEQHDAIHILFDCGTSIQDEISVHIWMLFATTANIGKMHRTIANRDHRKVLAGIGYFRLISIWLTSLPRIVSIILRSLRMTRKLVVEDLEQLKGQSILEIRREHGIIV